MIKPGTLLRVAVVLLVPLVLGGMVLVYGLTEWGQPPAERGAYCDPLADTVMRVGDRELVCSLGEPGDVAAGTYRWR